MSTSEWPEVYNVQVDGTAKGDGVTNDTTALQNALTAVSSTKYKRLYFPAGTYLISGSSGTLFSTSANGLEIFGDGVGKTVLNLASGLTLTSSFTIFGLSGFDQSLHDMSFTVAGTPSAALTYGSVSSGGSGYAVNDTITLAGGTFTTAAVVKVTSVSAGAITGAQLNNSGGSYTVQGVVNGSGSIYTQGSTSGTGTGAQFAMDGPQLIFCAVDLGALRGRLFNLDISGTWGLHDAGGAGVTTYEPPQENAFSTTLGTSFSTSGVHTVTPGSMVGIYPGRTLNISGSNTETIQVTSTTTTTFTATFAYSHSSTDTVNGWSLGYQFNSLENIYVHDAYQSTGFIINSSQNGIRNCRVNKVGMCNNQHGFYIQGGGNVFEACYVEGAFGFSYHDYISAGGFPDNSGNRFLGCWSVNPGNQHFLANTNPGDGVSDPTVPSGRLFSVTSSLSAAFSNAP